MIPPRPSDVRLGRHINFDEKSRLYPIRPLLAASPSRPRSYSWRCKANLDQGQVGACVGFSITHELAARPVEVGILEADHGLAMMIYKKAQQIDPWPGDNYEGTDVLSGVKIAVDLGYYPGGYRWAFGLRDVIMTLGYKSPVLLGINWREDMFTPDEDGVITYTGAYAGGHAILANRVRARWPGSVPVASRVYENLDFYQTLIGMHNSWRLPWGINGECWISAYDLGLALGQGGEACVPIGRVDPLGDPEPDS